LLSKCFELCSDIGANSSPAINRAYAGLLLIGCSVLLFLLVERTTVSDAQSDPWPMLLVSQGILEHQTIQLDAYRGRAEMGDLQDKHWPRLSFVSLAINAQGEPP